MNIHTKKIGTKVMIGFAIAMIASMLGVYLSNSRSIREFGYVKEIERARALTSFCGQFRTYMGNLNEREVFDYDKLFHNFEQIKNEGKDYRETDLYKTIPVVSAWTAAQMRAEELGYAFRVPKNNPRNPLNTPRPGLEQAVVNYLEGKGSIESIEQAGGQIIYPKVKSDARKLGEIGVLHIGSESRIQQKGGTTNDMNAVRFFRSIELTQDCMVCHGSPKGEKDPVGFAKEGWKVGEVHGAFEIIAPLDNLDNQITQAAMYQFGISGFVLIVSLIAIFGFLTVTVTKPLFNLKTRLDDIAGGEGDLTKKLDVYTNDEVGQVAERFNIFIDKLRDLVAEINESSQQVAASSEELAASSQHLASASTEQAASLETTSTAIEELVSSVDQNANHARKTNEMATQSANEADEGGKSVMEMVEAMKKITEQITIIDDIADQTNLLALNAAIEAARAGEMGKGFAVVAVEVRKLAERSQLAAKEINELSKNSVLQAEKAGNQIQNMVPTILKVSELMNEIAASCDEQSKGAAQIQESVHQIDQITQQNSATSEESASASEELAAQAQSLQSLVARFKIEEDNPEFLYRGQQSVSFENLNPRKQTSLPAPKKTGQKPTQPKTNASKPQDDEFKEF